jgi:cell division protein FtsL
MPEYVAALNEIAETQEHISNSLIALSSALVRSNEDQEDRSRGRFQMVYRILAAMAVVGILLAAVFLISQQTQINTLNTISVNQQTQLDNQAKGLESRNRQFDLARDSDLCSQRLNAAFFGAVATGLAAPPGTAQRDENLKEIARIGKLYDHIDEICYGPVPDTTPLDAQIPD